MVNFTGLSRQYINSLRKDLEDHELNSFFSRYDDGYTRDCYTLEEREVIKMFFETNCPGQSGDKNKIYRQLCPSIELYEKYRHFVIQYNLLYKLRDENHKDIKIRCYRILSKWKKIFRVRRSSQSDIDFVCPYCHKNFLKEKEKIDLEKKIEIKKRMKEKLGCSDEEGSDLLQEEIDELTASFVEVERELETLKSHVALKKSQRDSMSNWISSLKSDEMMLLFDFSKYNYAVHDLCFTMIHYVDEKLRYTYFHYLHNKWKDGVRYGNDGHFAAAAFKKLWSDIIVEKYHYEEKKKLFCSDGGHHFICCQFLDLLTNYKIENYMRLAPHHGGNACDGEFGVCKKQLRNYESSSNDGTGIVEDSEICEVLSTLVKERDAHFFVLEDIPKVETPFKSSPYANGLLKWFNFIFNGEKHKFKCAMIPRKIEMSMKKTKSF